MNPNYPVNQMVQVHYSNPFNNRVQVQIQLGPYLNTYLSEYNMYNRIVLYYMKYVIRNHIGLVIYINNNIYGFESGLGPIKSIGQP